MPLDMNVRKTKLKPDSEIDFIVSECDSNALFFWHDKPYINDFIARLYSLKSAKEVNIDSDILSLQLTKDDIDLLEKDLISLRKFESDIMFLGISGNPQAHEPDDAFKFISDAKSAIDEGYTLYCFTSRAMNSQN